MFETLFGKNGPRIIACCGSGGVGKTTISATFGFRAALHGCKTLVLTIDPAKRLADSMGLSSVKYEEQRVPDEKFSQLGLKPKGELYAMMLDSKRTFDLLVSKYVPQDMQERILNNRYYKHISTTLAGSHEYMAMEKLYEIYQLDHYDVIILDTPPSRRALDFLEAPQRVTNLLGQNMFWKIFRPYLSAGKIGIKMISFLASPFMRAIKQVLGAQMIQDTSDFFRLWDDVIFEGFRQRAEAVKELLSSEKSVFFGITSPMEVPLHEVVYLYDQLNASKIPFGGFIMNRVHPRLVRLEEKVTQVLNNADLDPELKEKITINFSHFQKMGASDHDKLDWLKQRTRDKAIIRKVTYFEEDVFDFKGLYKVSQDLFGKELNTENFCTGP